VTWDTKKGEGTFHVLPTRPIAELPRFSAWTTQDGGRFLEPSEVDTRIRDRVDRVPGGIDGRIVRLIIDDVPRDLFRDLDHRRLREYRARALHFHLDARRPTRRPLVPGTAVHAARPLEEEATAFLAEVWQPSSGDIQRERLVSLARTYLERAGTEDMDPLVDTVEPD
jgi:hypothetical protein